MCSGSANKSASKGRTQVPASAEEPLRGWTVAKTDCKAKAVAYGQGARLPMPKVGEDEADVANAFHANSEATRITPSFPHRAGRERAAQVKRTIETGSEWPPASTERAPIL